MNFKISHVGTYLLLVIGFTAAFPANAQSNASFSSTPLGQYIDNNPDEFSRINAFVNGLGLFVETALQQSLSEKLSATKTLTIKGLLACKDMTVAFAEATSSNSSSDTAIARYNAAMMQCRRGFPSLKPYMDSDPATMTLWQRNMTPLLQIPRTLSYGEIRQSYDRELEGKTQTMLSGTNEPAIASAGDQVAAALPTEPYRFDWQEVDQIRAHVREALDKTGLEDQTGYCRTLVESPNNIVSFYKTLNEWMQSCKNVIYPRGYSGDLALFSQHYRSAFYLQEQKMQANSKHQLPALPAEPFDYVQPEVVAIKSYMAAASAQSLNLSYAQQVGLHKNEACKTGDIQKLGANLEDPFVKQYWQQVVFQLQGCAEQIAWSHKTAGQPLKAMLQNYMAQLQSRSSRPVFGK